MHRNTSCEVIPFDSPDAEPEADAVRELEAFSYSVSHDLRSPLRHITCFVELLQNDPELRVTPAQRHRLDTIAEEAARMGELIDHLLAFSRIGRSEMNRSRVDLNVLVREARQDLAAECENRTIRWSVDELPTVIADHSLLRQAFVNLLSNAIKFTSKKKVARIRIECLSEGPADVVISVKDNGAGFDPAYKSKLFGVFQRLHPNDEFEGFGIGLANVHRIIHRHGGRTWADGAVGAGARFSFSLPVSAGGAP